MLPKQGRLKLNDIALWFCLNLPIAARVRIPRTPSILFSNYIVEIETVFVIEMRK